MKLLHLALVAVLAGAVPAAAQDWPTKPVRMVVPFAAGATPDIVMRLLGERLQAKTRQSFVVDNRPGASGNLGTDAVAKAAPDGTTIGISLLGPLGLNTLLFAKMPYDPFTDLALVTRLTDMPSVLAVNADVPAHNSAELLALLKREPGKFNYGSIGNGSLSHLAMEAIALKSGTQLVHIPYGSSPQAVTALIRGDVQIVCLPAAAVMSQVQTGKVRALAVTSPKRSALLPAIPTLNEAGIDVDANAWNGLIAPAKTPDALVAAIARAVNEALHDQGIREKLQGQYMEPIGTTPAAFKSFLEAEMRRWTPVVQAAKIKPN
ncbi:MAG: tripartite tricarboxylate transporter substrate binding protein [Xanthobacteraceae bacterium]|nr:tripartite tricarboxylate transporter substrate binding protein [Xanthobacteraceae bacterium]